MCESSCGYNENKTKQIERDSRKILVSRSHAPAPGGEDDDGPRAAFEG